MNVEIASLAEVSARIESAPSVTHVISIGDPGTPLPPALATVPHVLRLVFHDVTSHMRDLVRPSRSHVRAIVEFARTMDGDSRLVAHCTQGISRSSAAALTVLASAEEPSHPAARKVVCELLAARKFIMPNQLMVQLADDELGWAGKLLWAYRQAFKAGTAIWTPPED